MTTNNTLVDMNFVYKAAIRREFAGIAFVYVHKCIKQFVYTKHAFVTFVFVGECTANKHRDTFINQHSQLVYVLYHRTIERRGMTPSIHVFFSVFKQFTEGEFNSPHISTLPV